ncbi:MAG: RelA/SpoT family protein [Bacilli bacterium]|nr:RelA/SpoT family protein [Bacilli bacterium]
MLRRNKSSWLDNELINKLRKYLIFDNIKLINKALMILNKEQIDEVLKQKTIDIAFILSDIKADRNTLITTILYNLFCQNKISEALIEKEFTADIVYLVKELSKIDQINLTTDSPFNVDYYKRVLIGISKDVRVIIIKLAERLYHMRHIDALNQKERKTYGQETLEIFAPIAHRLGIHSFKNELEKLCLKVLKPDVYNDILEKLKNTESERERAIQEMIMAMKTLLTPSKIKFQIKGRVKSVYSIYKKLDKGREFSDIYDIYALRILTEKETDCYLILGLIHSQYKPIPKRFKDFIAMPKANGYQSLHTTVFGLNGLLYEIQIRTYAMDLVAEYGLAAHWSYKEKKKSNIKDTVSNKLDLFRSIIDSPEEEISYDELVNKIKEDTSNTNIYVFTPKGDVFELPFDSTPIDFAYKVHSNIGDKMIGVTVNNRIEPLDYPLKSGDIVKINVNKNSPGPSKEWLKLAKTGQARSKIRAFFSKLDKINYIDKGKTILDKELKKRKITSKELLTEANIKEILTKLKLKDLDHLYSSIGSNHYPPNHIINILTKKEEPISYKDTSNVTKLQKMKDLIIVQEIDSIKTNLASCCMPIIGDDIFGYITKSSGITVHLKKCQNLTNKKERLIKVHWNKEIDKKLPARLTIHSYDREKLLVDLVAKAGASNISIDSVNTRRKDDLTIFELVVLVSNTKDLTKFINDLYQLPYIENVERKIK